MDEKKFTEEGKNNKVKIGIGIAALILIVIIIAVAVKGCGGSDENGSSESGGSVASSETQGTEIPQITPIFMYFVSQNDEGYSDYMAVIEELKAEYDGRVEFQITDIDENPEAKENFPVDGQTPVLIMNNHNNDITAIEFKCGDKDRLTADIETAFE